MQYQGIEEQRVVNIGLQPIARDLGLDLVVTNDVHYLRTRTSSRTTSCSASARARPSTIRERLKVPRRPVLPEDRRGDGGDLQGFTDALARTLRIAERCHVDLSFKDYLPNFEVPDGFTLDDYFEHIVRQGFEMRLSRLRELAARGC